MTIDGGTFTCQKYHLDMPAVTADDFCARRHRKSQDGDFCFTCERGVQLAKAGQSGILKGWKREHQHQKEEMIQKGETMTRVFKDKECKKHGKYTPTGPAGTCPQCKAEGAASKVNGKASRQGEKPKQSSPTGSGAVPAERVLKVLVAAGFVRQETIDHCRKLIAIAG